MPGDVMVHISAHRGGSEDAQPATYDAYRRAVSSGAEYVEWDIRKTKDGVLVAYHDARAHRSGRLVADLEYRELCDGLDYEVPRVDRVMNLVAGKMIGHLDLKEIGYEAEVISLAESLLGSGNYIVTTLEDVSIRTIKRAFPEVLTALSLGRDLGNVSRHRRVSIRFSELFPLSRVRACGADWVAINYKIARLGAADTCKRHGIGVMIWTVDHDAIISRLLADQQIDVLITNRPRYAVACRAELNSHSPTKSTA
jgi:glycerophosphoryl diester phosphodiesterase